MIRLDDWAWLSVLNDEAMAGASSRRARVVLDEARRFEEEPGGAGGRPV
jgi:hypothetical protein